MKKYNVSFVEYNEMMELDGNPYEMLLNPITLEQLKEALDKNHKSYIREELQAKFLSGFLDRDVDISKRHLIIDKEEIYIAIRFMGPKLPENFKYLSEDHDIEIYMVQLIEDTI